MNELLPPPYCFGEGPTERTVFKKVLESYNPNLDFELTPVKGKGNFRGKIQNDVSPEFQPGIPEQYVRILVFRDVDAGENGNSIKEQFSTIAQDLLKVSTKWQPVPNFSNLHIWDVQPNFERPGLRMALHLADPPLENLALPQFANKTTDGYILQLALAGNVLESFSKEIKTEAAKLSEKILTEIPALFNTNQIPLNSEKDYLAAYLLTTGFWKVKRTEEKERLVEIILARAGKYASDNYQQVMRSWQQAIKVWLE